MEEIRHIQSISEFNNYFRQPTLHSLVSVGDLSYADLSIFDGTDYGMYAVVLLDEEVGSLKRNGKEIRYGAGNMVTLKPGQTLSISLDLDIRPKGWMLVFRPELLLKTGLGRDFFMFNFFNYSVKEALRLNSEERKIVLACFSNIIRELHTAHDSISGHMLRLCIGLLLSHCKRSFERQYENQSVNESDLQIRLDGLLDDYLTSALPEELGPPTVAWCAEQFHWTPNYFGDVVKRQLHITAQEYIQQKIIERAKGILQTMPEMSITQVAENLGFTYPNHFTRLFRKCVGVSPSEYRSKK